MKITKRQLKQLVKEVVEESKLVLEKKDSFNIEEFTKDFAKETIESDESVEDIVITLIGQLAYDIAPTVAQLAEEYGLSEADVEDLEEDVYHDLFNIQVNDSDMVDITDAVSKLNFGDAVDLTNKALYGWTDKIKSMAQRY